MFEVQKMLYGPRGWADLDDYRIAMNAEEEAAAARDGYFRAGEDAREDLVTSGKWHPSKPHPVASCVPATNEPASEVPADTGHNAPKRRGRPPKVA